MKYFLLLVNILLILVFSQLYLYTSLFRIHLFITFLAFSALGILVGVYNSFQSNDFVTPDPLLDQKLVQSSYLLSYEFYSDLILFLTGRPDKHLKKLQRNSLFKNSNKSDILIESDNDLIDGEDNNEDFSGFSEFEMHMMIFNDDTTSENLLNSRFSKSSMSKSGSINDSVFSEDVEPSESYLLESKASESTSKLETYLGEMIDLIVRDFLMENVQDLLWDKERFSSMAKIEVKELIDNLRKNFGYLDSVKIISRDLILKILEHFFNVGKCTNLGEKFKLNVFEEDALKEAEHLRKLVEIFVIVSLDEKAYLKNNALRSFVKEVILNKSKTVIMPTIDLICDPDFLNLKIISYLAEKEASAKLLKRTFSYAANYEEFIKMIKSSDSLDEMKQFHYKIMNEIMQATIISEFKEAQVESSSSSNNSVNVSGMSSFYSPDLKESDSPEPGILSKSTSTNDLHTKNTKAEMLRSRNLKAYLKQLQYAKMLCERRMARLKSSSMMYIDDEVEIVQEKNLEIQKNRKIFQFDVIIQSIKGQKNFLKFLEPDGSDHLLRFWIDVEKLKHKFDNIRKKYELANKIYENYLKSYDSPVRDEIGKELVKSMRLFLIGNDTDEAFFKAQARIQRVVESDYYPSFIVTDLYEELIPELENISVANHQVRRQLNTDELDVKKRLELNENITATTNIKNDQSKRKIDQLKQKLHMKLSALNAVKDTKKQSESKIVEVLDDDIKKLKRDISIYQTHIHKTQVWCENMGNWRTSILKARVTADDSNPSNSESILLFEIQVQLFENERDIDESDSRKNSEKNSNSSRQFKEGWFIFRSFQQFESLHQNLREISSSDINNLFKKLPSLKKHLTGKNFDEDKVKKATFILDDYLKFVSKDESLSQSEALYTFLCPSPDFYKKKQEKNNYLTSQTEEKPFSLTSIFRNPKPKETTEDDYLDKIFEDDDSKSMDLNAKDSIAEPFYHLLEELFELKGMKKWFRKSLILFVQFTYGATINRKIRECIYYFFSEEMLTFYLKQLKDSMWQLNSETNEFELIQYDTLIRSEFDKIQTKNQAKLKLLANIPEALQKLVGEKNAQIGLTKLFETFQDKKLNKHLVYSIFELLIDEMCPSPEGDSSKTSSRKQQH